MKLQLSIWAEGLPKGRFSPPPDPFAVVTLLKKESGSKPDLLGKTELIPNTTDPDWTKLFLIEDYQLGTELFFVVSVYNGRNYTGGQDSTNQNGGMGTAVFEVGNVLGAKGSTLGKELKDGGVVVACIESAQDVGSLRFQFAARDLINTEGRMRKSDPFFEIQRLRNSASQHGTRLWDTVFRSAPRQDSLRPVWGESYLPLSTLCGTRRDEKFRLAIYDFEKSGNHVFMGDCKVTLDELVQALDENGTSDNFNRDKALPLKKEGQDAGFLIVVAAEVTEPETEASPLVELDKNPVTISSVEEDFEVAAPNEEFTLETEDLNSIDPTFANFISGGCELHAMLAIDATASNGDPRQPTSLHRFDGESDNDYKTALANICHSVAKFDSDQKYPLYGFGAKKDGKVDHCFPLLSDEKSVTGVAGILNAYDKAFKAGITMSSPRDFSEVIRTCTKQSLVELESGHAYSILLLFTNGVPADIAATVNALREADNAPLSFVFVGIGEGNFTAMQKIEEVANKGRDKLRFVLSSDRETLSASALAQIPEQLENYFKERNIYPNPEKQTDEIVVEPYSEATDVQVPIKITENGEPIVTGVASAPPQGVSSASNPENSSKPASMNMEQMLKHGKTILHKNKKYVGRVTRNVTNAAKREIAKVFPNAKMFF